MTTEVMPATTLKPETETSHEAKTMLQIVVSQFLEHKFAVMSFWVILAFLLVGLSAPLISSMMQLDPNTQDVFNRYKPPMTRVPFTSDHKEMEIENYNKTNTDAAIKIKTFLLTKPTLATFGLDYNLNDTDFLITVSEVMSEEPEFVATLNSLDHLELKKFTKFRNGFSTLHILGTDELGRDVFIRLIYGTRVSVGIGIFVALASAIIGLGIGSIAGFYGGFIDSILMRVTDSLLSLPLLPVLIVVAAVDLKKLPFLSFMLGTESESIFKLILVLCLFSWMTVARLVRGSILAVKELDFIHAAKTLGAKDHTIILTHIIPNVMAPLLVTVTLNIGQSILTEAALSFLGLGIQPPIPSWGNMLYNAQEIIYEAPLLAIMPGLLILAMVISFNFFGDGLQDAMDPKAIRR